METTYTGNKRVIAAAAAVMDQIAAYPVMVGIPLDADVAGYLGAFEEDAISPDDLAEDAALIIGPDGEARYAGEA
jgi:hypothetical protein